MKASISKFLHETCNFKISVLGENIKVNYVKWENYNLNTFREKDEI